VGVSVRWAHCVARVLVAEVLVGPRVAMLLQSTTGDLSQFETRCQSVVFASDQKDGTADPFDRDRGALNRGGILHRREITRHQRNLLLGIGPVDTGITGEEVRYGLLRECPGGRGRRAAWLRVAESSHDE